MNHNLKKYLLNPRKIGSFITMRFLRFLPDDTYLRLLYYFELGHFLNLKNPQSFNEKLQWLKLYNRQQEYTNLVDKYLVKEFVNSRIGNDMVIPTLGVWDRPEDIDFTSLPDKFVLKTTHGGGSNGVYICKDKNSLSRDSIIQQLNQSLKRDIYSTYREWPYKNVKRRIIAEVLLENKNGEDLRDYKFFCFNGIPRFFKVDCSRFKGHRANYYDLNWELLKIGEVVCPPDFELNVDVPLNFDKMVDIVLSLCKGFPFIRIDLYNVDGKIYFGEFTFFPAAGMGKFVYGDNDRYIGKMLSLPVINHI